MRTQEEINAKIKELSQDADNFTNDNYGSKSASNGEYHLFFSSYLTEATLTEFATWLMEDASEAVRHLINVYQDNDGWWAYPKGDHGEDDDYFVETIVAVVTDEELTPYITATSRIKIGVVFCCNGIKSRLKRIG